MKKALWIIGGLAAVAVGAALFGEKKTSLIRDLASRFDDPSDRYYRSEGLDFEDALG